MTETPSEAFNMIIVVAVIALISIAVATLITITKKSDPIERCRMSVLAADKTKVIGESPISIDCKRIDKEVKLKDVLSGSKVDEEKIKKQMAEQLRLCWYKMGEGKLYGFNRNLLTSKTSCVICSKLVYDKKIGEKLKEQQGNEIPLIGNFHEYLKKTKMPNSDIPYAEYLSTSDNMEASHILYSDGKKFYDTPVFSLQDEKGNNNDYFIVYRLVDPSVAAHNPVESCLITIGVAATIGGAVAIWPVAGTTAAAATTTAGTTAAATTAGAAKISLVTGALRGSIAGFGFCLTAIGLTKGEEPSANVWAMDVDSLPALECDAIYQ